MSTLRRSDSDYRDRRERNAYNYSDRRDGERDRRNRDYDRNWDRDRDRDRNRSYDRSRSRSRSRSRERRDIDRSKLDHRDKAILGPRETAPHRSLSSPLQNGGSAGLHGRPLSPRRQPTASTTPVSSRPSSPKLAAGSSRHAKIMQALQSILHRNKELTAIQLRREIVENRVRERENIRNASQHKYAEFPSLRETHRRSEKKDQDDLAALRKEEEAAHARSMESSEQLASLILQASDLQQEKDDRAATVTNTSRLEARLDELEKQHQNSIAQWKKELAFETAQRKALDIENKTLKSKLSKLEKEVEEKHTFTSSALTEQENSIKRWNEAQPKPSLAPTIDATVHTRQASDIQQCIDDIVRLRDVVSQHDSKLGHFDPEIFDDACNAVVTKIPQIKQECDKLQKLRDIDKEKLAADLMPLRSRLGKLESDAKQHDEELQSLSERTKNLESDTELLKADCITHKSRTTTLEAASKELVGAPEKLSAIQNQLNQQAAEAQHPTSQPSQTSLDTHQFIASLDEIKWSIKGLQTNVDALNSTIDGDTFIKKTHADTFLTKAKLDTLNKNFLIQVGGWIDGLRKRVTELETGNASARDSTTTRQRSEKVEAPMPREIADPAIKKLSDQVDMNEKSLQAVRGTINSMRENEKIQEERMKNLEEQRAKADDRMDGLEKSLGAVQTKMDKRMDVVDQQYLSLDSQMNNLTTEGLYSAIISHLDKEQPGEAQLGQKVQTIIKQMSEHEHRLIKVEKSSRLSEEPARKRQKLSPNGHEMAYLANGNH